ncbi:MAG: FAD-dependent oxidoreductase [Desulfatibacillum sp.]|nr:FAD-dependent oxidoreductase [Desulfatibacillum sp.]
MHIITSKKRPRVLIVGANFGGLSAAKALPKGFQVTVLDPWPYFEFLPNIHELVSQIKKPGQIRISRRKIVEAAGHRFLQEKAAYWLPRENYVKTENGTEVPYDFAICAIGGAANFFNAPGAEEIAVGFKSVEDCHAIGKTLAMRMDSGKPFSIAIVGGGIEGVEALGEVLRRYGKRPGIDIHLIDGNNRVLGFGPPGLHEMVVDRCRNLPVSFHMGRSVRKVSTGTLELADGETIPADMTIWTGGVKPRGELLAWGLARESGEWAPVNDSLRSIEHPNLFVVGDTAGLNKPLAKQAYHAMDMGKCAARNIIRLSKGKKLTSFKPSPKPTLITFGNLDTYLVADSFSLAGPALSFAKEAVYQTVMPQFDPGWKTGRAVRAAARLTSGIWGKALPYALSPKELICLGNFRVIR